MCTIFRKLTIVCYERECAKKMNLLEKMIVTNKCLLQSLKLKQMFVTKKYNIWNLLKR